MCVCVCVCVCVCDVIWGRGAPLLSWLCVVILGGGSLFGVGRVVIWGRRRGGEGGSLGRVVLSFGAGWGGGGLFGAGCHLERGGGGGGGGDSLGRVVLSFFFWGGGGRDCLDLWPSGKCWRVGDPPPPNPLDVQPETYTHHGRAAPPPSCPTRDLHTPWEGWDSPPPHLHVQPETYTHHGRAGIPSPHLHIQPETYAHHGRAGISPPPPTFMSNQRLTHTVGGLGSPLDVQPDTWTHTMGGAGDPP